MWYRALWKKPRNANRRDAKTGEIQQQHAWRRLLKRFGIALHLTEIDKLVQEIQEGKWRLLQRQSRRVSVFEVVIEGKTLAAVYDRDRHAISTFLPVEWISRTPPRLGEEVECDSSVYSDRPAVVKTPLPKS